MLFDVHYFQVLSLTALVSERVVLVVSGSSIISGGEEGVLVRWQYKTEHRQFVPRLVAPINHIAVSPDDSLTAVSQKDNSKSLVRLKMNYTVSCLSFTVQPLLSNFKVKLRWLCNIVFLHNY